MRRIQFPSWSRIVVTLVVLLILKVTAAIVWQYQHYFPADFQSEFLSGRQAYFYHGYHWFFYTHIVASPVALLCGLLLVSPWMRGRFPAGHRRLGRIQGVNVLCCVVPSGLVMAWFAVGGPWAVGGLALLAIFTATTVLLGWKAVLQRRFADHQRWMWRNFLLLCSAVLLRLLGGLGTIVGVQAEWFDAAAIWVSWLFPLLMFEVSCIYRREPISDPWEAARST